MKILFYSDPHLWLSRASHTTSSSASRLRDALFNQVTTLSGIESDLQVCLGDLFDSYSNSEAGIQQGARAIGQTRFVLAGNHDVRNSRDSVSSLRLLSDIMPGRVILNDWGDREPTFVDLGGSRLVFVPHIRSQEEFEQALEDATAAARESKKWNVLCLHCNVEMEARDLSDTTLNLSKEKAKQMLTVFHSVFIGHEHNPRDLYAQRLRVVGNLHPTGFADISDKRVLRYDTETGKSESISVWKQEGTSWQGMASELPESASLRFLDLEDDLPPGESFKRVSAEFKRQDGPYCIRLTSNTKIERSDQKATLEEVEKLPDLITSSIEKNHKDLLPLWEELKNAALATA